MTENQNPLVLDKNEEISEQKADDIRVQLRQDPEVQRISQQIDVKNQMELLEYGKEPAVEISKFSDKKSSLFLGEVEVALDDESHMPG